MSQNKRRYRNTHVTLMMEAILCMHQRAFVVTGRDRKCGASLFFQLSDQETSHY